MAKGGGQRTQRDLEVLATGALATNRQDLAEARFGLSQVSLIEKNVTATVKRAIVGSILAKRPAKSLQRLAAGVFRLGHLAFESQDAGESVERLRHGRVIVAQKLFSDLQRFTKQTFRLSQFTLILNDDSELG